jgi:diaminohydroxyphosphoribosylaminopyrimidine deaminase / 5-amino-6-(5-phosphoribosylamino)uracil reductase
VSLLERAIALARAAEGRAYPKPTVGAIVAHGDSIVAEGVTEPGRGGRHAEVVALDEAGGRARGATLHVTLEPCAHHGSTPPCADRVISAGVARVVVGARDPNPVAGGGVERLRRAGVEVELVDAPAARRLEEAWRTWVATGRPFVVYKTAVTLDGRVAVPGRRWISGAESRRLVHGLRARLDAVAVGAGTALADRPRLDARDVPIPRGQPRRLVFSRRPLPEWLGHLERRSGPLAEELAALGAEGVQSLLLEGGPTLAASFAAEGLVDKVLVFVGPTLAGDGPGALAAIPSPLALSSLTARPVGADILLEAYVHEP